MPPKTKHTWKVACPYCGTKVTAEAYKRKPKEEYIPYRTTAWRKDDPHSKERLIVKDLNKKISDRKGSFPGNGVECRCPKCAEEYETAQNSYFKLYITHQDHTLLE